MGPNNSSEAVSERIRAAALHRLGKKRSQKELGSILGQAGDLAHKLTLTDDWPKPLSSEEKARLVHLIEEAKPLVERAFPLPQFSIAVTHRTTGEVSSPTFGELCGKLLELLKAPTNVARGRPRDSQGIFARRMLEWGAGEVAEKRLGAQLKPRELCSVALIVGVEVIPDLKQSQSKSWEQARWKDWEAENRVRWEKLHQRNLPHAQADRNPAD